MYLELLYGKFCAFFSLDNHRKKDFEILSSLSSFALHLIHLKHATRLFKSFKIQNSVIIHILHRFKIHDLKYIDLKYMVTPTEI